MNSKSFRQYYIELVDDVIYHWESSMALGRVMGYLNQQYRSHINYESTMMVLRKLQQNELDLAHRKLERLLDNEVDDIPYEDRWHDLKPDTGN